MTKSKKVTEEYLCSAVRRPQWTEAFALSLAANEVFEDPKTQRFWKLIQPYFQPANERSYQTIQQSTEWKNLPDKTDFDEVLLQRLVEIEQLIELNGESLASWRILTVHRVLAGLGTASGLGPPRDRPHIKFNKGQWIDLFQQIDHPITARLLSSGPKKTRDQQFEGRAGKNMLAIIYAFATEAGLSHFFDNPHGKEVVAWLDAHQEQGLPGPQTFAGILNKAKDYVEKGKGYDPQRKEKF
jgi:hypothetical protein